MFFVRVYLLSLMLRLFRRKMFSIKYFWHFSMFSESENMINKNHFQFIVKVFLILRKWFKVWKIVNRFLDLNSSFLHGRLWKSTTVGHWSLLVTRLYHRRSPDFGIRLSKSGWPNSSQLAGIWPVRSNSGQTKLDSGKN
jgi:hypothetical protein